MYSLFSYFNTISLEKNSFYEQFYELHSTREISFCPNIDSEFTIDFGLSILLHFDIGPNLSLDGSIFVLFAHNSVHGLQLKS